MSPELETVGSVNDELELCLVLDVRGPTRQREVQAIVDTGFSGMLVLPERLVAELGLRPLRTIQGSLADGSVTLVSLFAGQLMWFGRVRVVEVVAAGSLPLVGVHLLSGFSLAADFVPQGRFRIGRLSGESSTTDSSPES
jgi:clan AA aspartic protease